MCLKSRNMFFIGDSTVRQYAEYFLHILLKIKINIKAVPSNEYQFRRTFNNFGINITYLQPEMPFFSAGLSPKGITSQMTEIERIADSDLVDSSIVLVTGYYAHYRMFPFPLYEDRVNRLARAIRVLIHKKPRARVFIKGPHFVREKNNLYDSRMDQVYRNILFHAFDGLKEQVFYLDAWILSATFDNENTHVYGKCFEAKIQQFMSYLC